MLLLSEEPGSDICSFSTVEDSSRGNSGDGGGFRILDVDDDFEIVERAATMLLFWFEMDAAAMATRRESVLMVILL